MKTILPLILLLPCLACGQTNNNRISDKPAPISNQQQIADKPATNSNWKQLDKPNYSIQYPGDWELEQSGTMGSVFAILAPLESKEDKFRENVNLVVEDLKGQSIDLDRYAELAKGQLKSTMTNFNLVESKKNTNGTREYFKVIFTWNYEKFQLKVEQYYWVVDGKAYVLTFTSEQAKFANFSETGEKILNTFTFKK
jgi:hypothetical protein